MKLNVLTVVTTSNKMEGSSDDPEAQASKGAGTEAVVNTKQVQLVGKLPLIDINPDRWNSFNMDPAKKASILTWLQDSPSSPDIPVKNEEIIHVQRIILQYVSNEGVPSIEDTAVASAKSLFNKATTMSSQLNDPKQFLQKNSKVLNRFTFH